MVQKRVILIQMSDPIAQAAYDEFQSDLWFILRNAKRIMLDNGRFLHVL